MKMNKFFMLGLAGLAFAACSNEEDAVNNSFPEGTGAVTVKIVSPTMTRSVESGTPDGVETVDVKGDVAITLVADNGTKTINLTADQLTVQSEVTFWNVNKPNKVTVTMNGGERSYEGVSPTDFMTVKEDGSDEKVLIAPENIPVYGEVDANGITLTPETASPGNKGGSGYEVSVTDEAANSTTVYQLYKATVKLAIPVARLEVSGIKHVTSAHINSDGEDNNCAYETLNIAGVYLDNVYATGNGVTYANGAFPCASGTPNNYSYDGKHGTGEAAIWKDAAVETDFLTMDGIWPEADGQAYCYYFFGADGEDNLPKFKIYFDESVAKDGQDPLPAPRYAMITKYWNEGRTEQITKFEPGHIYRITSAQLTDNNIIGDEGGNTLYGVEVTVKEATWTVETITADWAE